MKNAHPHEKNVRHLAAVLLVGMTLVLSAPDPAAAERDNCAVIGDLAGAMMTARQNGASLANALSIVRDAVGEDSDMHALVNTMVLDGWGYPRMHTADYQRRAVAEFRDRWHLACLQSR